MGKLPKRILKPLYLAEWIKATGRDQGGTAKAAGVNQSYISNLSGGRRGNPSAHVLLAISDYLGITVNDLYQPPPPAAQIESLGRLSPAARDSLIGKPKRQA